MYVGGLVGGAYLVTTACLVRIYGYLPTQWVHTMEAVSVCKVDAVPDAVLGRYGRIAHSRKNIHST